MTEVPELSVVVPAKNEGRFIGACLSSIVEQSREVRVELIVVDNGSDDDTIDVSKRYGARVVPVAEGTVAYLRNCGAQVANAPFIAFMDADCTADSGWARSAIEVFEDDRVSAAGCYPRLPDGDTTWVQRAWVAIARPPGEERRQTSWLPSANMIVRASTFSKAGGFDEQMETAEDADLTYRLGEHGKVIYDEQISAAHHREPSSLRIFFKKEIWHGLGSFDGVSKGRFTAAELPSLIAPVMTLFGIAAIVTGAFVLPLLTQLGIVSIAFPPVAYTLRALSRSKTTVPLAQIFVIYTVYHLARAVSVLCWLRKRGRRVLAT